MRLGRQLGAIAMGAMLVSCSIGADGPNTTTLRQRFDLDEVGSEFYQAAEFKLRLLAAQGDVLTSFVNAGSSGSGFVTSDPQSPPELQSYAAVWCGRDVVDVLAVSVRVASLRSDFDGLSGEWAVVEQSDTSVDFESVLSVGYGGGGPDESQAFGEIRVRLTGEMDSERPCVNWELSGATL